MPAAVNPYYDATIYFVNSKILLRLHKLCKKLHKYHISEIQFFFLMWKKNCDVTTCTYEGGKKKALLKKIIKCTLEGGCTEQHNEQLLTGQDPSKNRSKDPVL